MTTPNLKALDPAELMPTPKVPTSYGPRNAEEREIYELVTEALHSDQWTRYDTVQDCMKDVRTYAQATR